jgi:hypothetical protein
VKKTETGRAWDMHGKKEKIYRVSVGEPERSICSWENTTAVILKKQHWRQ